MVLFFAFAFRRVSFFFLQCLVLGKDLSIAENVKEFMKVVYEERRFYSDESEARIPVFYLLVT